MLKTIPLIVNTKIPIEDYQENYNVKSRYLRAYVTQLFKHKNIRSLFKIVDFQPNMVIIRPRNRFTPKRDLKIVLTVTDLRAIDLQLFVLNENDEEENAIGYSDGWPSAMHICEAKSPAITNSGEIPSNNNGNQVHVPGYIKILSVDALTKIYFFGGLITDLNIVIIKTLIDQETQKYQFSIISSSGNNANEFLGGNSPFVNSRVNYLYKGYWHQVFTDGESVKQKVIGKNVGESSITLGFPASHPYYNKGANIGSQKEQVLHPFQEGDQIIKNVYYLDGGSSTGTLVPSLCKINDAEYYIFLSNIVALNAKNIIPYVEEEIPDSEVFPPIKIVDTDVGNGSKGIYFTARNTNLHEDIKVEVYKNNNKVKEIIFQKRNDALTPSVNYDGVDFQATMACGEQGYILRGNPGDNFKIIFSSDNNYNLLKYLVINSINIFVEKNLCTTEETTLFDCAESNNEKRVTITISPTSKTYYFCNSIQDRKDTYGQYSYDFYIMSKNKNSTIPTIIYNSEDVTDNYSVTRTINFISPLTNENETWYCTTIDITNINLTNGIPSPGIYYNSNVNINPLSLQKYLECGLYPNNDNNISKFDTFKFLVGGWTHSVYPQLNANAVGKYFSPEGVTNLINLIAQYETELTPIENNNTQGD